MASRFSRVLACGSAAVVLAFGACSAAMARDLVIALKTEPSSMDPQYHALTPNTQISQTIFDTLVATDAQLKPVPALAESWTVDGKVWTFKLRPGVKFSDGTPFTAEDVVFTYDRVPKVPNSPSPFTLYLGSVAKTEAVDPMTLRITTKDVAPNLLVNLAQLPIMSKKAASGPAAEGKTTTELNSGDGLVGTGPYKFVSWKRGAEFVLARNDSYWGKKPEWDKVIYRPISNPAARVAALLAGDVDMIEDPPPTTCPSSRATRSSTSRKPLGARGVRGAGPACRALARRAGHGQEPDEGQARARGAVAGDQSRRAGRARDGRRGAARWQPAALPHVRVEQRAFQGAQGRCGKAKALLKEAGYPNGFSITLGSPSGRYVNDSKVAQAIASMWTRIGVKTSVDAMAPPVFFKNRDSYAFSAYLAGWSVTSGEMSNALTALLVTRNPEAGLGTTNRSRYSNPKMDELVKEASSTMDDAKRADLLARASNIAMDDYAMLPVHFELSVWAMKGDIRYQGRPDQVTLAQFATLKK